MSIYTKAFWRDASERVVSSAAQGFLTGSGLAVVGDATLPDVDLSQGAVWAAGGFGALTMGVQTFAKCLVAARVGPIDSGASFSRAVQLRPQQDMVRRTKRRTPRKAPPPEPPADSGRHAR